jgi:hypothetical protein
MSEKEMEASPSRREFVRTAAFVGLAGAVGAAAMAPSAEGADAAEMEDPKAPKGLGPKGIPDLRFPICYQSAPKAVKVLTQYFAALSRRDLKGMADVMHFPFGTYEGTDLAVVPTPEALLARAPASMNMNLNPERFTDHDGYLKPGAYDVFGGLEVLNSDPVRVNLAMTYYRYGPDGKMLLRCQGVYASTIFTPADLLGVTYQDTIQEAKRLRINHDLAYQVSEQDGVWARVRAYGRSGGVGGGGGNGTAWQVAPDGNDKVMQLYRFKGVKNRLGVGENTPDSLAKIAIDFKDTRDRVARAGVGYWGFPVGTLPDTRVLHATVDKAHMYSGVTRYNVTGEEISNSVEVSIITYVNGRWGWSGSLSYITNHDRANDVRS